MAAGSNLLDISNPYVFFVRMLWEGFDAVKFVNTDLHHPYLNLDDHHLLLMLISMKEVAAVFIY